MVNSTTQQPETSRESLPCRVCGKLSSNYHSWQGIFCLCHVCFNTPAHRAALRDSLSGLSEFAKKQDAIKHYFGGDSRAKEDERSESLGTAGISGRDIPSLAYLRKSLGVADTSAQQFHRAYCEALPGGLRVKVKLNGSGKPSGSGGVRSVIRGFSGDSQRRCEERIMAIPLTEYASESKRSVSGRGYFLSLTFHDEWSEDFSSVKAQLYALLKRIERRYPNSGYQWKLEPQKRGAPHFHVVLLFEKAVSKRILRAFVRVAWWEICGKQSAAHRSHGANVQIIHKNGKAGLVGVMCYVSKYVGKRSDDEYEWGRRWGVRGNVPSVSFGWVNITQLEAWVMFLKEIAGFIGSDYVKRRKWYHSGRLFCDGFHLRDQVRGSPFLLADADNPMVGFNAGIVWQYSDNPNTFDVADNVIPF